MKRNFIAIDGRDFDDNPLAICMKTKEFKPNHLIVHLAILNLLNTDEYLPVSTLISGIPDNLRWKRHGDGEIGSIGVVLSPTAMERPLAIFICRMQKLLLIISVLGQSWIIMWNLDCLSVVAKVIVRNTASEKRLLYWNM
jgi:hypothetical protein